ncbi:MAG: PhzF family phenazine biosynthesis protein, partial [Deinococcus sp.]
TSTLGLVLYALPGRAGEDADFRAFGPLAGFGEDHASSNTAACLLAGLSVLGLLDPGEALFRLGQGHALGLPSRLTLQASLHVGGATRVWVGGATDRLSLDSGPSAQP